MNLARLRGKCDVVVNLRRQRPKRAKAISYFPSRTPSTLRPASISPCQRMNINMRIRELYAVFACSLALSVPAVAADDAIGMVKNVDGRIDIVRGDRIIAAAPGSTLQTADRLQSGPNASAGVVFNDGTLLTLGPSSQIEMRDYAFEPKASKYAFSAYLAKGTAIYSSGTIGKIAPQSVTVATPQATVGVRGTRFVIEAQ